MSKKIDEIQELCDAQIAQIFSLRQEIEKYKKDIKELKQAFFNNTGMKSDLTDEEFIAINELKKLKLKSETEDLTYEDAKRVELYFKVLNAIRLPKEDKTKEPLKELTTEDLLSQLSEN